MRWLWLELDSITEMDIKAETLLVMPATDRLWAERAALQLCRRAEVEDAVLLLVEDRMRVGFITIANRVFRATQSLLFGYLAQDAFAGRQWLKIARESLLSSDKGLLGFNDGKWHGMLAAFGLGRRSWLERHYGGDLFYSGYRSHYADTELTLLALGAGQYVYNPQAILIEVDWDKESRGTDRGDKQLFAQRKTGWLAQQVPHPHLLERFR